MPFAIYSDRVVTPAGITPATVVIEREKIIDVVSGRVQPGSFELIDGGDKLLMAGVVDPHVHINEPGRTDWEGFDTASKAAIAGGITTLADMPLNSSPVTTSAAAFAAKQKAAQNNLHADCGFWGGIIPGNENEIEALIKNGVMGFKAFLTHSGIEEFPNVTETDLRKAMPIIAAHALPLLVHCELQGPVVETASRSRSYNNYLRSRPREWENAAIELMIRLCEEFNCPVHIVHLSSAESLGQIRDAKEKGLPVTVETGQHYLFFSAEQIADGATVYKCAPPIREAENNERLWEALQEGLIDFVATDHSPAPPAMKELGSGDFMNAWGGIASLQFAVPALWTKARARGRPAADIAKWLCEKPAMLPGLSRRKGKIEKGYNADLVLWDPETSFQVTAEIIQHRHKLTPYLGETLFGVVHKTYLGGINVFDSGIFNLNQGKICTR